MPFITASYGESVVTTLKNKFKKITDLDDMCFPCVQLSSGKLIMFSEEEGVEYKLTIESIHNINYGENFRIWGDPNTYTAVYSEETGKTKKLCNTFYTVSDVTSEQRELVYVEN